LVHTVIMQINVSVNSFVKLLLVVAFFIHVSTATAALIDDQYVEFREEQINFFDENGARNAYLLCPSGRIDIKIGQEVTINPMYSNTTQLPSQITVELINGYEISFNYNFDARELTFTINPSSSSVPELKEAGIIMLNEVVHAMHSSLVPDLNLKQVKVKVKMPQGCLDDGDKTIYTSSFEYDNGQSYRMYARCYRDHYMVLVVRKDLDPFAANGVLPLGVKVVIGVFIPIGLAVAYYRMAKRRSPTADTAKKEQTGRNSSQSKGKKPGGSLPRKKARKSAHKVPKIKK